MQTETIIEQIDATTAPIEITGGDAVMRALVAEGVDTIFG